MIGQFMIYDGLEASFHKVTFKKQPGCQVCGDKPIIHTLTDSAATCADSSLFSLAPEERITPEELHEKIQAGTAIILLDIRVPVELQISTIPNAVNIPLERLSERLDELDREKEIVVICRSGRRSARGVSILKKAGFTSVKNLTGGINAWVSLYQPETFRY
jgi:adenylyltransferase/sulfurtransferase